MKRIIVGTLAIGAMILMSGCMATGKKFDGFTPSTNNKGTVYIYRPHNLGVAINYNIYDITRGNEIGFLRSGGYVKYETDPGNIKISITQSENTAAVIGSLVVANYGIADDFSNIHDVNIKPNDTVCIRWYAHYNNSIVDKETCRQQILTLNESIK